MKTALPSFLAVAGFTITANAELSTTTRRLRALQDELEAVDDLEFGVDLSLSLSMGDVNFALIGSGSGGGGKSGKGRRWGSGSGEPVEGSGWMSGTGESGEGSGWTSGRGKSGKGKSGKDSRLDCNRYVEHAWEALDVSVLGIGDASTLKVSIKCDSDCETCTVRYTDDAWTPPTCSVTYPGNFTVSGAGFVVQEYYYDGGTLNADEFGPIVCRAGDGGDAFGEQQFVLQEDGSMEWFEEYYFWKISNN